MAKKIQYTIPTPCHESWEKMTPTHNGKYCSACSKTVIDFSLMSDQEMLMHISRTAGNVCGRFVGSQLARGLQIETENKIQARRYVWKTVLAFILSGSAVKGQTLIQGKIAITHAPPKVGSAISEKVEIETQKFAATVIDSETENAIPFASISILPVNIMLAADSNGKFELPSGLRLDSQKIIVSAVGFESKTVSLSEFLQNPVLPNKLYLTRSTNEMKPVTIVAYPRTTCGSLRGIAGGLMGVEVRTVFETLLDTVAAVFVDNRMRVFPNPVAAGATLQVAFNLQHNDVYQLSIINGNGQLLRNESITIQAKNQVKQIFIPATYAKGVYFIRLTNRHSKDILHRKFMVR